MEDVKFWRYYIPSIDGIEGWGVFILDSTGMFAAVTDYGNYAYMWPLRYTGCKDFREFFKHRDAYYVLGKCAPSHGKEYQGDKTEAEIRNYLLQSRREGNMIEEEARREWDLLEEHDLGYREGFHEWYQATGICDAHEYAVYDYTVSERMFADVLFPKFCDAVKSQLDAERTQAPESTEQPSDSGGRTQS